MDVIIKNGIEYVKISKVNLIYSVVKVESHHNEPTDKVVFSSVNPTDALDVKAKLAASDNSSAYYVDVDYRE